MNEQNKLYNRNLHISGKFQGQKVDIQGQKVDIQNDIIYIDNKKTYNFSGKTISHIQKMLEEFGYNKIFGRSEITKLLGLKNSSASKLISKLKKADIIESVSGYGKGKYRFKK